MNRGIKHDFPFINIRKVPRDGLKTEDATRDFQHFLRDLKRLMNGKIIFEGYYCINSIKPLEKKKMLAESSHFLMHARFHKYA